jgi:RHS repeat-associated protein
LAGQYFDAETGLHHNWHREYDPEIGRYQTPDPIGLEGGVNLFVYSENSPANKNDITGLNVTVIPTPGGPVVVPIPPPPSVTFPGRGKPFIPPNLPNFDPDPGDEFKLCMLACKAAAKTALKCPSVVSTTPCAVLCLITVLFGDQSNP